MGTYAGTEEKFIMRLPETGNYLYLERCKSIISKAIPNIINADILGMQCPNNDL